MFRVLNNLINKYLQGFLFKFVTNFLRLIMYKIEKLLEDSVREALKNHHNGIVLIRFNELETLIEKVIQRALKDNNHLTKEPPEFGGVALAMELTGYKRQSIYQMVSSHQIPFIKKRGKLQFSRSDLIKWLLEGRNRTINELWKKTDLGKM